MSRPVWGAWIEIQYAAMPSSPIAQSRPVWGAWIEITTATRTTISAVVAPRMGRVD